MKEYTAYLFDADGTLMDTREMIYQSFLAMFTGMSIPVPPREDIESTVGLPVVRQVTMFLGEGHPPEYYNTAMEIYRDHMDTIYKQYLAAFPGVEHGLRRLRELGKRMAVVTSRRRRSLVPFLEELNLLSYFDVLVTPDDTERHKPDPEPALFALNRLGVSAPDAVFIGDAEFDICCGKSAGTDTAFVVWGGMDHTLWSVQPDFVADCFADLLPEDEHK